VAKRQRLVWLRIVHGDQVLLRVKQQPTEDQRIQPRAIDRRIQAGCPEVLGHDTRQAWRIRVQKLAKRNHAWSAELFCAVVR
jgi:phage terminase small subunit